MLVALGEHGALGERALARCVVAGDAEATNAATVADADGRSNEQDDGVPHPDAVATERVEDVHLSLVHAHLPLLDETTLVEHDRDDRRVEPGPRLAVVEPLLAYADTNLPEPSSQ